MSPGALPLQAPVVSQPASVSTSPVKSSGDSLLNISLDLLQRDLYPRAIQIRRRAEELSIYHHETSPAPTTDAVAEAETPEIQYQIIQEAVSAPAAESKVIVAAAGIEINPGVSSDLQLDLIEQLAGQAGNSEIVGLVSQLRAELAVAPLAVG